MHGMMFGHIIFIRNFIFGPRPFSKLDLITLTRVNWSRNEGFDLLWLLSDDRSPRDKKKFVVQPDGKNDLVTVRETLGSTI